MMVSKAILFLLIGVCLSGAERDLSQFKPLGQTRPVNPDYQQPVGIHQQTKPALRPSRHQRSADPNSPTPPPGHQSKPQTLPGSVGVAVNPLPAEFVKPAVLPASLPGRHQRSADPNSPTPPPGHQSKPQTLPGSVGVAPKPLPAEFVKPAVLPASLPGRHQRSADPNSPTPPPGHQSKPQTLPGSVGVAPKPLPAEFVKPVVLSASLPGRHQRSADPNSPTPPLKYQPKPQTLPGSVGVAANPLPADLVEPALQTDDLNDIELAFDDTASLEYSSEDFSDSHKLSPIIGIVIPSGITKPTIGVTVLPIIGGIGLLKPTIVTNTTTNG